MENERITSAGANPGESRQEASLRPQHLDEYIGQQGVKENLKIFIQAAWRGQESFAGTGRRKQICRGKP